MPRTRINQLEPINLDDVFIVFPQDVVALGTHLICDCYILIERLAGALAFNYLREQWIKWVLLELLSFSLLALPQCKSLIRVLLLNGNNLIILVVRQPRVHPNTNMYLFVIHLLFVLFGRGLNHWKLGVGLRRLLHDQTSPCTKRVFVRVTRLLLIMWKWLWENQCLLPRLCSLV
jgi:hypothetical protein